MSGSSTSIAQSESAPIQKQMRDTGDVENHNDLAANISDSMHARVSSRNPRRVLPVHNMLSEGDWDEVIFTTDSNTKGFKIPLLGKSS